VWAPKTAQNASVFVEGGKKEIYNDNLRRITAAPYELYQRAMGSSWAADVVR
jgi:hypothetical protein